MPKLQILDALVKGLVIDKAQKTDGVRVESNKRAIEIVKETYGPGVGLGSNRASSFFASLVSNTGVLGALFFAECCCLCCGDTS